MNDIAIALALHVLAIVVWIGGVGFATLALLPAVRRLPDIDQRLMIFEAAERRFAPVARGAVLLAGATGFYMVARLDAWRWFNMPATWWMSAMLVIWVLFALLLFVLEPFFLRRRFATHARAAPDASFRNAQRLHWILLIASLVTIFGAAAGSHGLMLLR